MKNKNYSESKLQPRFFTIFALLFCLGALRTPFFVSASYPLVRNFTRQQYGAAHQNWAAAQSPDGIMLFGNTHGLMSFNGSRFQVFPINYGSAIRSIAIDSVNQRVYVGGSDEFGYFAVNPDSDTLRYESMRELVNRKRGAFSEFWNIMLENGRIWLQEDFDLLLYDNRRITIFPFEEKITASALSGKFVYVGFENGRIALVNTYNNRITFLPDRLPSRVSAIEPIDSGVTLIATSTDGIYIHDSMGLKPYMPDMKTFLSENQVFCMAYNRGLLAIGTVRSGALIYNMAAGNMTYANLGTGLQNNTVLCAAFDNCNNLWLGLDNGISYVMTNSPIRSLFGTRWDNGSGYAALRAGNSMWFGTNQGLFATPFPIPDGPRPPESSQLLKGQIWNIDSVGSNIFVSSDLGLFLNSGSGLQRMSGIPGTLAVIPLKKHPGYALAASYDGYHLLKAQNGSWANIGKINGFSNVNGYPVEDTNGHIWLAFLQRGLYRMTIDIDKVRFTDIRLYDHRRGLPGDENNTVQIIDGNLMISTAHGIYRYNSQTDSIEPNTRLSETLRGLRTSRLQESPANSLWILGNHRALVLSSDRTGVAEVDSSSFRSITSKMIPGHEKLFFLSPDRVIAGYEDGFFDISTAGNLAHQANNVNNPVRVTSVSVKQDSIVYQPVFFLSRNPHIELPYNLNSLRISYVAPEYEENDAVLYSVALENGRQPVWSSFSTVNVKEYTDLHEGEYTFHVRAFNTLTGASSECSLHISILPPWYRTITARIIYTLVTLLILYALYVVYLLHTRRQLRRIEQQKKREMKELEDRNRQEAAEKDREIERLKLSQLELDIKNKSLELSNSTLNLVRKNEILLEISEMLTKLTEMMGNAKDEARKPDPRHLKHIDKIKDLIRQNISHDDDWKTFTKNFDVVYHNYLQRLVQQYPALTVTDQRVCAYIRMGLSSKDMAPLLNISYRSVEMSRYRLRKKLGLAQEVSLSSFLREF